MKKPNILMCHRISGERAIANNYYDRNLVIPKNKLYQLIESLFEKGFEIGTINEAINNPNIFHLTFDDGYIEHLYIANELKKKFLFDREHCTFCINVGNSIIKEHSGMDLIYTIINKVGFGELECYFGYSIKNDFQSFKTKYIALPPVDIMKLREHFNDCLSNMDELFLNVYQIKKLSKLFSIASHGITHRDLRYSRKVSEQEILNSKIEIENIIQSDVSVLCYPEGKNDMYIQLACRNAGYNYGLSINHEKRNNYCIGRYCINRHLNDFARELDEQKTNNRNNW